MAFLVQARDAMEKKAEELGFELMKVECADTDAFDSNMRAAIEEGADLIICMGGQGLPGPSMRSPTSSPISASMFWSM